MKKTGVLILAGVISVILLSCGSGVTKKNNNDLAKLNLKGKIESLQYNLYEVDDENDYELIDDCKQSETWLMIGYHADWDITGALLGLITSYSLKFDENGNIVKISNYDKWNITYNEEDNVKNGETWRFENDRDPLKFKYIYDDEGTLTGKKAKYNDVIVTIKYKYNDDGVLSVINAKWEGEEDGEEECDILRIKYNEKMQVEKLIYVNDDYTVIIIFDYDANKNVSKTTIYTDDVEEIYSFSKYKYDKQGNWIKCRILHKFNEDAAGDHDKHYVVTRKIRYE